MRNLVLLILLLPSIYGSAQLDLVNSTELESLEEQLNMGLAHLEFAEKEEDGTRIFDALLHLGDLYRSKRNYTKAIDYYRRSLAYSHGHNDWDRHYLIKNRLARVLFGNAQYEEAIEAFEDTEFIGKLGQLNKGQIDNNDLLARSWIQLGELETAKEIYLKIYEKGIGYEQDTIIAIDALAKAAEVSNGMGDYQVALDILERARGLEKSCETDPNTNIYLQRAYAYNQLSSYKEAIGELLLAESSGLPYDAEIQQHLAQLYMSTGKKKDALNYVNKAIANAQIRDDATMLIELYTLRSSIQALAKSFEGSLESVKMSSALVDKVRTKEILDESKKLRIEDFMVNVENQFRQRSLRAELEASDEREEDLKKEASRLKEVRARLEKEKQEQELALLKEKEALNIANLKAEQLDRKRIEQEARLLRQQNISLQSSRDLELLDEQRVTDSLRAAQIELEQKNQISIYQQNEQQAAFEAAEKEATLKRNRLFAIILGSGLLIAIASGLNTRRLNKRLATQNNQIEEQRVQVEAERERAEQLLLNVLPRSIAEELKANGVATPKKYESATVLFTDFVGFTSIASSLAPEEIIEELNYCFTEFDNITQRHNIEKIKTIGDSYMCAGGVPVTNETHAQDAVRAGQEMVAYMKNRNEQHQKNGKVVWPIRVGIHTGELVAGVVGSAKFAYDIWGDTVNVASRMERGAEHNSINVSEETYQLIKLHFDCIYRGEIDVKNKGLMGMYRVV